MSSPRKGRDSPAAPNEGAGAPSFEERLAALAKVVDDLEGEDLPLEASLQRYREGVEHLKACRSLLDDAEKRLAELVAETGPDGETKVTERPLEVTEQGLSPVEQPPPRSRKPRPADDVPF